MIFFAMDWVLKDKTDIKVVVFIKKIEDSKNNDGYERAARTISRAMDNSIKYPGSCELYIMDDIAEKRSISKSEITDIKYCKYADVAKILTDEFILTDEIIKVK